MQISSGEAQLASKLGWPLRSFQLKEVKIRAMVLVPLIMTLRGSYWSDEKDSLNEVIMTSLQGQ